MSTPEQVYALLVEANPVPDPAVLGDTAPAVVPRLQLVDREFVEEVDWTKPVGRPRWWIPALVAALVAAAVTLAILLVDVAEEQQSPVITQVPETEAPRWATSELQMPYATANFDQIELITAIQYKESDAGLRQTFDLYRPAGGGSGDPLPVVILFHGLHPAHYFDDTNTNRPGQAITQTPIHEHLERDLYGQGTAIAANGMAAIAFGYHGYPVFLEAGEPSADKLGVAVQDARDMLAWLDANAAQLNLDPNRLCVWTAEWGSMPGAYTAIERDLRCAVVFAGPLDAPWAGQYSPLGAVGTGMPPFFVGRAAADTYSVDTIDAFVRAAGEAGADVTVARVPYGFAFEYTLGDRPDVQQVIADALVFLQQALGVTGG